LGAYLIIANLITALINFILEIPFYHYIPNVSIEANINVILSHYVGFGLRIATIILRSY